MYEPEGDKSKSLEIKYCKIVCVLEIMPTVKHHFNNNYVQFVLKFVFKLFLNHATIR